MSISFNLKEYDLSMRDFELLINKTINNNSLVNGYMIKWDYTVIKDKVVLSADLVKR